MAGPPTAAQKAAKDWYVSPGGNVWQATGTEATLLKLAGWQGPMTYNQALVIEGTVPAPLKDVNQAVTSVGADALSTTSALGEVGDFFHRITEGQTWVRVGEVALGGILLYAGIRALASGSPAVGSGARKTVTKPVRKTATRVASVAVPEARLATRVAAKRVAPKTTGRVAAHRTRVAKYGAKKPYSPPVKRQPAPPRVTTRVSHIYHHKGPAK
jgi:hypothetical protein